MKVEQGLVAVEMDEFADSPLPFEINGGTGSRMDYYSRASSSASFDEFQDDGSSIDTDEGRLSRALQSWRPDYIIRSLTPLEKPPVEPVFSGRLGKEKPVTKKGKVKSVSHGKSVKHERRCKTAPLRRVPSDESIATKISLLTCSSIEAETCTINFDIEENVNITTSRRRKSKRKVISRASTNVSEDPGFSIWVELSNKRSSIMNRLNKRMMARTDYGLIGGESSGESEAFQLFDEDEQKAVFGAGLSAGIKYINTSTLKRSGSTLQLVEPTSPLLAPTLRRTLSTSAKKGIGKPIDIAELKRERMNRLMALEQAKLQLEKERRRGRRGGLSRKKSSQMIGSGQGSPPATTAPSTISQSIHSSSDTRPMSPSDNDEDGQNERVAVWKGDREILEIDLKKELTERVKQRITTTRTALKRHTGLGDGNEQTKLVGKVEEFPKHVEEDFCHKPKIIQRMRISPHLSDVIHDDIQVRMGRPRYHEIRITDLVQWNKGQSLNRAHRNLKVFNWLHSLRESEFDTNIQSDIPDEVPDLDIDLELLHVESADEPDLKPLYKSYEVRIL